MRIVGKAILAAAAAAPALLAGGVAQAQLVRTVSLPEFSRDRNKSVNERSRPDFDPVGVQVGSFLINPALSVAAGATDNVLLNDANKRGDIYTIYEPTLRVASNWSRHRISVDAAGDVRRYANTSARNQNAGYVNAQGRLDVRRNLLVVADAQYSRVFESPFSDDLGGTQTAFSQYDRRGLSLRGIYSGGRLRATGIFDSDVFRFDDLRLISGQRRSQATRNRTTNRGTALVEYGVTPTVAFYSQAVVESSSYPVQFLDGSPNRDSTSVTMLGGVNFDIAGLMRGAVGMGYTSRDYRAASFRDVSGLSVQGRLDFFPTELTTLGLSLQRQFQDANLGNGGAYIDNRIGVDVDHELLQNLIVSASASRILRSYAELDARTNVVQASARAQFQMTRSLSFALNTLYGKVSPDDTLPLSVRSTEWRGQVSVRIRR